MPRLRASNASTPLDRKVLGHLQDARRSLQAALSACDAARGDRGSLEWMMARRMRRDVVTALAALDGVRRTGIEAPPEDTEVAPVKPTRKELVAALAGEAPPTNWDDV